MLEFASVDEIDPGRRLSVAPPPLLNRGLFTGAPIIGDRAAIPPTTEARVRELLSIGAPPLGALAYVGGTVRPGNNQPVLVGHQACFEGSGEAYCLRGPRPLQPPGFAQP